MSILIIHPKDQTTEFLKPIYDPIPNKTIITGGVTKTELRKLIETHDRIIMLGHGTPFGLMSVGQFPYTHSYIIDETMATLLSQKKDNIYIWCNADRFVKRNQLSGFSSGMFISELIEDIYYDYWSLEQKKLMNQITGLLQLFQNTFDQPLTFMNENVIRKSDLLSEN